MVKKILSNSKTIRILIFLVTAIIFVAIFMLSKDNIDEKSDSRNVELRYSQDISFKENILEENKLLNKI